MRRFLNSISKWISEFEFKNHTKTESNDLINLIVVQKMAFPWHCHMPHGWEASGRVAKWPSGLVGEEAGLTQEQRNDQGYSLLTTESDSLTHTI